MDDPAQVFDAIPSLIWSAFPDGELDFVNQRWSDYTGLRAEDTLDRAWQKAIHPLDLPLFLERWRFSLTTGEPAEMEARLRRNDGVYRWFVLSATPLRDERGRILKWYGASFDIDDRKRTEEAVTARDLNFHRMVDSIPGLVAVTRANGEPEHANPQFLAYFGITVDQLKGWASSDYIHPDHLTHEIEAWIEALTTGRTHEVESRYRRVDGVYRWCQTRGYPLRDPEGRIVRWFVLITDIEDRKRAESLLADEKRLLEMVAGGRPLHETLDGLCRLVESAATGCRCSVFLTNSSGTRLERGVSPSMPAGFLDAIIRPPIDAAANPSAAACGRNVQVISEDVASETRWRPDWCEMALAEGVRACWATPFSSGSGQILGAFTIYYDRPGRPAAFQQSVISQFTNIASIAVERAQNDAALRKSEARKAAILDSSLDCIITIDHEGRITEFNPAAERTFGYGRAEVMGRRLVDVVVPHSLREKHSLEFGRFLSGESRMVGKRIETSARRADGTEFPIELTITRIVKERPMQSNPTPIVFVVDDDISVRESLELLIRSAGWRPETYSSAGEFLARQRVKLPSCLVLDISLPDLSGLDVRSRAALGIEAEIQELRDSYLSLTQRERQVMALVVAGRLNKQVGDDLGISEITVKAHRGKVMQKMKASSFAQLVTMAARLGIGP